MKNVQAAVPSETITANCLENVLSTQQLIQVLDIINASVIGNSDNKYYARTALRNTMEQKILSLRKIKVKDDF